MDSQEAPPPTLLKQSDTSSGSSSSSPSSSSSSSSSYSSDNDEKIVSLSHIALAQLSGSSNDRGYDDNNNIKDDVSDDEGYMSGEEEFVMALDKAGEGNSDLAFVDASPVIDDDDDDESLPNGVGVDDVEKGGFESNGDVVDSVGTSSVNFGESGGGVVDDEVKRDKVRDVVGEDEVKGEVTEGESPLVDAEIGEVGDSVVDAIQVDVAGPGVVVVGETSESGESLTAGDGVSVAEVKEEVLPVEPNPFAVGDEVSVAETIEEVLAVEEPKSLAVQDDVREADTKEDAPAVEPRSFAEVVAGEADKKAEDLVEELKPLDVGGEVSVADTKAEDLVEELKPLDGGGEVSVADTKAEDLAEPESLAVAGEVSEADTKEEASTIEPTESLVDSIDAKLSTEGDSVVDTIQVDVAEPGVVVVGEMNENRDVQNNQEVEDIVGVDSVEQEKVEVAAPSDLKVTPEGDSIIDAIQVEVAPAAPGVAVVGEMEKNDDEKIAREVSIGSGSAPDGSDVCVEESSVALVKNTDVDDEKLDARDIVDSANGRHTSIDSANGVDMERSVKEPVTEPEQVLSNEATENGIISKSDTDREVDILEKTVLLDTDVNQPQDSNSGVVQSNGNHPGEEDISEDSSEGEADDLVFGTEAAKRFIEVLEQESGMESNNGSSLELSQQLDGQIVTDSEEEGDSDDDGDGKEMFDSAALAALLKAATGADSTINVTSQDGSRLFSVERPAGLGSSLRSLRPAARSTRPALFGSSALSSVESDENLSEDEKKKLEKLQQIRVKFLRLVHRLGLSPEESVAAQVLYRLALLGGRQGTQTFSLDAAKEMASKLESEGASDLDFSVNILVLGKSGVGKSATINSIFGDQKTSIDAFGSGTASTKAIFGEINGVKVHLVDTPGLKSSVMEQGFNRSVLSSVQKVTKKNPPDVVLYVDRLDAQTRDLNDLPLLKTVTGVLGPSIWRSSIVTLTHGASAPPDGPSGTPLSYEVFVSQRSHVVQQLIGHAVGDLRMMSPSLMNPVSLVENHRDCRKNREGQKILPNGQSWRPQLLLLCYSMKILSEASSLSKPQDPFDHRKLFGFRARSPPVSYMLQSMMQSRSHPKLASDQGADSIDSDIDLDDFSDSDQEDEDEYDQLPPFKPLKRAQLSKLSSEQKKAYFEEYDYRVKLLQKKQWREELKRMREIKKRGKDAIADFGFPEEDPDSGAAAPIAVPLPDMALPPSFDGDNPAYRYRFLEPTSQFLARPVLDSHGWDHDCGYDGVNLEHSLAILNQFPLAYTIQVTKDKKDFTVSLDSSVAAKHGDKMSSMLGFDIQSLGKQLAYIFRGETKFKNLRKNKATAGVSFTVLGENVVPGVKIEDQITIGKQYLLVGCVGAVKSQQDAAYGANFELQRRKDEIPVGQVESSVTMSLVKWRGELALGFSSLVNFSIGRNSKVAVRAGINNKMSGQLTVRTSSSDHLSLALAAVLPTVLSIYKKLRPASDDKYSIY